VYGKLTSGNSSEIYGNVQQSSITDQRHSVCLSSGNFHLNVYISRIKSYLSTFCSLLEINFDQLRQGSLNTSSYPKTPLNT